MEYFEGLITVLGLSITKHVQRYAAPEDLQGPYSIDGLLHLAVPPVAALDSIGCGRKKLLIQERQCLLQRRGEQLLEGLADRLESADTSPQLGKLLKGGIGPASAIEETVDLIHDLTERQQFLVTPADPSEQPRLGGGQMMLDKEVAVFKEVADLLLKTFLQSGVLPCLWSPGATARGLGDSSADRLAYLGDSSEDRLRQLRDDMELANLVRDITEDLQDRLGIESRAVGRDSLEFQATAIEDQLEASEEPQDILVRRVVVEDFVENPLELSVIHDREHAEGAVVQLIDSNISGEVPKRPPQVVPLDPRFTFFFPTSRPSSVSLRRGRRPGGHAIDARRRHDTRGRPR
jgi:hypothetical protein